MIDRWANLPQLRADGQRVLRWIARQGVVMCNDPAERERAKSSLLPVFLALEDVIRPLPLVAAYVYRQKDQPPGLLTTDGTPMRSVDGIAWVDVTPDKGKLHAIGLSCEALERGPGYTQFLFLHELTHVFGGGDHSTKFHKELDRLIAQFNQRTGGCLVNDRFGLQMHHDSRSYAPFEAAGNPPPVRVGNREFRTGQQGRII